MMSSFAQVGIAQNNITGFGAFVLTNMNLLIFVLLLIFILGVQVWGTSQ
jgi:hypothetical protein